MSIHKPVLLKEVLKYLDPKSGDNFIDGTFGAGGHALPILEGIGPKGKLIGIEWDPLAIREAKKKNQGNPNLILFGDNYKNLKKIYKKAYDIYSVRKINGILLDLGLSSDQLSEGDRGFSFQDSGVLDLRYNQKDTDLTAVEILNTYSEQELFKIFSEYGEEPLARQIVKKLIENRRAGQKVETAAMLVQLVSDLYKKRFKARSKRNPATRVFQALRIAVNNEFGNVRKVLPQAIDILTSGGRLAVISFHSGEDRIVKNVFRDQAKKDNPKIKILTKKPLTANEEEVKANPRSRSAKMRVVEKL